MVIEFYKYQGTGNDFIIIDNRTNQFNNDDVDLISALCERRMGIGADGLILLQEHCELDFEMKYFNSDGKESTMCGNGGRCIVDFASHLGIITNETIFMAVDGQHKAKILDDMISLQMQDVSDIRLMDHALFLDTGSPHYVTVVDNLEILDVNKEGKKINQFKDFKDKGVNVNFIFEDDLLRIRTYERGVNQETLSCGTGAVASAIAMHYTGSLHENSVNIETRGGGLIVSFDCFKNSYKNIWLTGQVSMVYAGEFVC